MNNIFKKISDNVKYLLSGRKVCILGMTGAGKTRILKVLQNQPYNEHRDHQTKGGGEPFERFICKLQNGVELYIRKGIDYNGDDSNIIQFYEDLLSKCEIVFFVFDINKYLHDKTDYAFKVNARINYINRHKGKQIKEMVFLGTHLDEIPSDEERKKASDDFYRRIQGKTYVDVVKKFKVLDATKKKDVEKILCELFKK